jgi:hypothetical protein
MAMAQLLLLRHRAAIARRCLHHGWLPLLGSFCFV